MEMIDFADLRGKIYLQKNIVIDHTSMSQSHNTLRILVVIAGCVSRKFGCDL